MVSPCCHSSHGRSGRTRVFLHFRLSSLCKRCLYVESVRTQTAKASEVAAGSLSVVEHHLFPSCGGSAADETRLQAASSQVGGRHATEGLLLYLLGLGAGREHRWQARATPGTTVVSEGADDSGHRVAPATLPIEILTMVLALAAGSHLRYAPALSADNHSRPRLRPVLYSGNGLRRQPHFTRRTLPPSSAVHVAYVGFHGAHRAGCGNTADGLDAAPFAKHIDECRHSRRTIFVHHGGISMGSESYDRKRSKSR